MTLGKKVTLVRKTKKKHVSFMPHAFNQNEHPLSTLVNVSILVLLNLLKICDFL